MTWTEEFFVLLLVTASWRVPAAAAPGPPGETENLLDPFIEVVVQHPVVGEKQSIFFVADEQTRNYTFTATSCRFDPQWTLTPLFIPQNNQPAAPPRASLATLSNQKVLTISRDQPVAGIFRIDILVYSPHTPFKIFLTPGHQSGYVQSAVGMSVTKDDSWFSWKPVQDTTSPAGHVKIGETCVLFFKSSDYNSCHTCEYLVASQGTSYGYGGSCAPPVHTECGGGASGEPPFDSISHLPDGLRYVREEVTAVVTVASEMAVFGERDKAAGRGGGGGERKVSLLTPYDLRVFPTNQLVYSETPQPYVMRYISLRSKEEVPLDLSSLRRLGWQNAHLIIQACATPVKVKIDGEARLVEGSELITISPDATVKLRNGHKHITAARYVLTDDAMEKTPLVAASEMQVTINSNHQSCNSVSLVAISTHTIAQFCLFVYNSPPMNVSICSDPAPSPSLVTKLCDQPDPQDVEDGLGLQVVDLRVPGLQPDTQYFIEAVAKPAHQFYPYPTWTKVASLSSRTEAVC